MGAIREDEFQVSSFEKFTPLDGVACLIIVSRPGPDLSRSKLGLVRSVTRSVKARFGHVGDQVS